MFEFIALLIVVIFLFNKLNNKIVGLHDDIAKLKSELQEHKDKFENIESEQTVAEEANLIFDAQSDSQFNSAIRATYKAVQPPPLPDMQSSEQPKATIDSTPSTFKDDRYPSDIISTPSTVAEQTKSTNAKTTTSVSLPTTEPDEQSLPVVTSLIKAIKNWFFGGNLVVRVGVLVLLVGVVLLLRLLSEYIEIPIHLKLIAIGMMGLGLAGLGFKLTSKRFAYGITLQGAGLAIAYLSTFFAYSVYHVIASLPSFIVLGILSASTIGLAVRQNAFPLAMLALSGGFFAPILTSDDTGNLVTLFSYYLLLNVTIAIIAHYRPWKVLNLFGVMVTFGLAYYWGINEDVSAIIESQRWSLVLLVTLHVLLYLFVVTRYAQQIMVYNASTESALGNHANSNSNEKNTTNTAYLFPIDTGLLFSVPLLAFGLFAALLQDIPNALTLTSSLLATVYLGLGWLFIQRSQHYALITEGMLALGFGFLALVVPLALDAEWIAFGWSVQGLALVWFGRRSLRAWSILFGLLIQLISISILILTLVFSIRDYPTLALTVSAMSCLATVFILRACNSPITLDKPLEPVSNHNITTDSISTYAIALGVSKQAATQWLIAINSQSRAFNIIWRSPIFIRFLTFIAMAWALYVLIIDFDQGLVNWQLATTTLVAMAALMSLAAYWIINHYRLWNESSQGSHGIALIFYAMLVLQLPQKFEFDHQWTTSHWILFATLLIGWLVIGQLWIRTWYMHFSLSAYDSSSWLGAGIVVLAAAVHYGLPDSHGVMAILVPAALMSIGLWLSDRYPTVQSKGTTTPRLLYWFDWQRALLGCTKIFIPIALGWVLITNWSYDGKVWELAYFPLLNLYDLASWLVLLYGLSVYYIGQKYRDQALDAPPLNRSANRRFANNTLLVVLGIVGFWLLSSMLIRTLHAFIGTPLWDAQAWSSEQVQTGLTILWTLLALVATIIASRYRQRTLWFMGIGLLGVVVLKLVLVDLSQTEAIWRVVSFLGAGSLILLIGYLAPLPPARDSVDDTAQV